MVKEYQKVSGKEPNPEVDWEAQQAARNAVMEIALFPDLFVALRDALPYGPHVEMLQHFCYWMHPRKPKMQNRWTLYITYKQWKVDTGLRRKQVDKGRKVLRELGLVEEKKGPHGRVHYRVDWVALADVLSLSPVGEHSEDSEVWLDDLEDEISLPPVEEQGQFDPQGGQGSLTPIGVHANTGEYAAEYLTEESTLQVAPEPSEEEPGAQAMDGEQEQKQVETHPVGDNVASRDGHALSKTNAGQEGGRGAVVEITPRKPDDLALLAEVEEILNPDSGKWWGARFVAQTPQQYKPEKLARYIADDEELPHYKGRAEELLPVVRYLMSKQGAAA